MIGIYSDSVDADLINIIYGAFIRSFTPSQITLFDNLNDFDTFDILLFIDPNESSLSHLINKNKIKRKKIIIFGSLPKSFYSNYKYKELNLDLDQIYNYTPPAKSGSFSESKANIEFHNNPLINNNELFNHSFERYDFVDEWNNLNYGFISNKKPWNICQSLISLPEDTVASIVYDNQRISFITVHDNNDSSIIWINRSVGLVDSHEWHIIEEFVSNYRSDTLNCLPYVSEIPFGYDSLNTMRFDCDESLTSLDYISKFYHYENIPFSIAVPSHLFELDNNQNINKNKFATILSHSHTHPKNWGGNYEESYNQAYQSKKILENFFNTKIEYAVSPFHQSPDYSLKALKDAGYKGCVGGISTSEKKTCIARGGTLVFKDFNILFDSQQVMLHGDCILDERDKLKIYKNSFDLSFSCNKLFGYLDHPFSSRYNYGWDNEDARLKYHKELIHYIKSKSKKPKFVSEEEAFNLLANKDNIVFTKDKNQMNVSSSLNKNDQSPTIHYKGKLFSIGTFHL